MPVNQTINKNGNNEVGNSEGLDKPTDCVIVVETKTEEGKDM